MWHKPQLMNAVADLLLLAAAAALLVAAIVWVMRQPSFPLREVRLVEAPAHVGRGELKSALGPALQGNFFNVDLAGVRRALERLPWVRRAEVRRVWPDRLEVRLEEQRAVARWGEGVGQLVNVHGEVFYAAGAGNEASLPVFSGPPGEAPEVFRRYREFGRVLAAIDRRPQQVSLSARLAWRITLDDGMVIELGREQERSPVAQRLQRFADAYRSAVAGHEPRLAVVDLRYPNGFALRTVAVGGDSRGRT